MCNAENLFFHTVSIFDKRTYIPITLGIVSSNGKQFYAEFDDFDSNIFSLLSIRSYNNISNKIHFNSASVFYSIDPDKNVEMAGNKKDVWDSLCLWMEDFHGKTFNFWGMNVVPHWISISNIWGNVNNVPSWISPHPLDLYTIMTFYGDKAIKDDKEFKSSLDYARYLRGLYLNLKYTGNNNE